ncbi:MAG TPA: PD-(D/E)XK nuclease family protein, partial [Nitrospira sp.]|nr:PD-(D/E)XK nuclease family protein [Nitrospira sp.]
ATRRSLWRGPRLDGITYSLLCKFLQCPERFRLQVVEGLREPHEWNYHIEYGNLFHAAEEARLGGKPWQPALSAYYTRLRAKYPANERDITRWYLLCKMQFPLYVQHWQKHETEVGCRSIYEEKPFRMEYKLSAPPYGGGDDIRVILRGKLDSAYEKQNWIWLKENKTKGEIDPEGISTTVDQNLQTMMYHIALRHLLTDPNENTILDRKQNIKVRTYPIERIAGTVYNVIRRPLSDRNAPRQKKKESDTVFIGRVGESIAAEPHKHFYRWIVPVSDRHIRRFQVETFDPLLRRLVAWWDAFNGDPFSPEKNPYHFRYPFGAYHALERGYRGDFFKLLTTGSKAGLERTENLFPEL